MQHQWGSVIVYSQNQPTQGVEHTTCQLELKVVKGGIRTHEEERCSIEEAVKNAEIGWTLQADK